MTLKRALTIGDLICDGKLLEIGCLACNRHLCIDPASSGLPLVLAFPHVASRLRCSGCGAINTTTLTPIWWRPDARVAPGAMKVTGASPPWHIGSVEPTRNLIMVYRTGAVDVRDFDTIREKVEAKAPDIAVFIVEDIGRSPIAKKKPPDVPPDYSHPVRSESSDRCAPRSIAGKRLARSNKCVGVEAGGIAVPKWTLLTPETRLSREDWGATSSSNRRRSAPPPLLAASKSGGQRTSPTGIPRTIPTAIPAARAR